MSDLNSFSTPMMRQYARIKKRYPEAILFFRLGDFYEMFLEDAQLGAQVLGITLTSRHKGKDGRIPMAGVPYHAADNYIAKLVERGYKVAICEQVSLPNESGLVEREVVRVVTPGTLLDEKHLPEDANNYLAAIYLSEQTVGLAWADLGTGDFRVTQSQLELNLASRDQLGYTLGNLVEHFQPREIILPESLYNRPHVLGQVSKIAPAAVYPFSDWPESLVQARVILQEHFGVKSLEGFGLGKQDIAIMAAAALVNYLVQTQRGRVSHLKSLRYYYPENYLVLDTSTVRNLELFSTLREGEKSGSLWSVLHFTRTAMGGRLLRRWLLHPLLDTQQINARLDAVEWLFNNENLRSQLVKQLASVKDIERVLGRLSVGVGNPRDLQSLRESLLAVGKLGKLLAGELPAIPPEHLSRIVSCLRSSVVRDLYQLLKRAIQLNPGATLREGNYIRRGYSVKLDNLRRLSRGGKDFLLQLERREREATEIENLKIGFNRVHGYYIEVTKSKLKLVPRHYLRRQTLANAERYITVELKEYEEKVLRAEEQIKELEYQLYLQVVALVLERLGELQQIAQAVAQLDLLSNFAELAKRNRYVRPKVTDWQSTPNPVARIKIIAGRHPVIEKLQLEDQFVPNDTYLDTNKNQLQIITGANMAGKSTYIRQVALIVLMAQMGCFVPADEVEIGVVDRIFTRLGASDQLAAGLSTFMVEMIETANILNNARDASLVILDEVGRGTSTYDGISIAWSVAEHLALNTKTRTLFATHYHELTELADTLDNAQNYYLAVADDPQTNQVVFLYRVQKGKADRSYGIHVAQHAGLPATVLRRAKEILALLEEVRASQQQRKKLKELPLFKVGEI